MSRLLGGVLLLLVMAGAAFGQTARVQVIHNSPDPDAALVDVYVGAEATPLVDDFAFRTATPFVDVPAGVALEIGLAPSTSTGPADVFKTLTVGPLGADTSYVAVVTGVADPASFAANPDGYDTGLKVVTFIGHEVGSGGVGPATVDLAIVHGAPDAPTVDIIVDAGPFGIVTVADNAPYGALYVHSMTTGVGNAYQPSSPASFTLDITPAEDQETIVASFDADLRSQANKPIIVLASGFLDPSANKNGPRFGLLAVLPTGESFLLPPPPMSIREINRIPDEALAELKAKGADLVAAEVTDLVKSAYDGQTVRFVAVVMSNPLNSGRASVSGGRVGRVHVFVRDTTAASQGPAGMGMQIVDGRYEDNGTLALLIGDVIDVVGTVTYFSKVGQFTPSSIEVLGNYQDFGLPASILDPVEVTTGGLNVILNDEGKQQANWDNYSDFINQFVKVPSAVVQRRSVDNTGRPHMHLANEGEAWLFTIDGSLRYRNDRVGSYPAEFNVRAANDPYVPPPPGARINLSGFIAHESFDPLTLSQPTDAMLKILPWEDSHLEILESPPLVRNLSSPSGVVGTDPVPLTVDVFADPARTTDSVVLRYIVSTAPDDTLDVPMALASGDTTFSAEVPGLADEGAFVLYFVEATDSEGAATVSDPKSYRVLPDGITKIDHIQRTFDDGPGDSPFRNQTVDMDITATVQTDKATSNVVIIQDDPALEGWSGIELRTNETLGRGDVIHITNGRIEESFGLTRLRDATFTVESTGGATLGYKLVTSDLLQNSSVSEAHEGMMLRFENVLIVNNNADAPSDFGEFTFASVSSSDATLRSDDASPAVEGGSTLFAGGEIIAFLQGYWSYSFSNYKLEPESPADFGEVTNVANEQVGEGVPSRYTLEQNYPNPFNPTTTIGYSVTRPGAVRLEVYDMMGRVVATLVDAELAAGTYRVTFDAGDLASGVYLYRLTAGSEVLTQKMLLQK